jgi:Protein of unknown function, DUF488
MNGRKKPSLQVIAGAGRQATSARPPIALALSPGPAGGQQLALPGVIPSCAIISVSPAALFTRDLAQTMRELRARHIVDMRLAVEFGSLGLRRRDFDTIVERLGLTYRHARELANQNHELTWNPTAMWTRFREQLRRDPIHAALLRLRDMVDDGPLVLLSESPYHEVSERFFVMEALQEIRPGFAYHHIDPAH